MADAEKDCATLNANLASIHSKPEQDHISGNNIVKYEQHPFLNLKCLGLVKTFHGSGGFKGGAQDVLIGMKLDREPGLGASWTDKSPVDYADPQKITVAKKR